MDFLTSTGLFDFAEQHSAITIIFTTAILLAIRSVVVNIPRANPDLPPKKASLNQAKHGESLWFFLYYSTVFTTGIIYLWDKEWLWDPRTYWLDDITQFPVFPVGLRLIYTTQTAFYIGASLVVLFFSHARANHTDKLIMLTHHFVTIVLLAVSYAFGQHRIGSVVLILHDVSDIFLEGAKLCRYNGWEGVTNTAFAIFALVFFVSRLIVFPLRVLYAIVAYHPAGVQYGIMQVLPSGATSDTYLISFSLKGFWLILLGTLQCLHIYWFALIFRMIVRALQEKHIEKDIRSDEESDLKDADSPKPKKKKKND